ncbi:MULTISPECIES: helix-turn-helix domain-containing protein [Pseudanabaena]|jgi:DNA-binding transcriptional regulator YiaG|uniref:helix-turn-helix domain-containing protein n=1 Tax=Pseudanabaena TaxID=1152 RepID=UPI00247A1908|nr:MULTISPECIES: helix-turn-helix domain-containing protein [Pseudanabaena]MEA5487472.1 helix-turn-helix domain-containing protein [Pseudanabaena sp. CCNP1317]WGS74051.1 helix-turn-helix domain-containing protein [Pseudanabaena galeata CCNP1313]
MKLQVKNYANLIEALQSRLDLNQVQLAQRVGTTPLSLSRWKNGHTTPSPMAIALLKQAVNDLGDRGTDLQKYF